LSGEPNTKEATKKKEKKKKILLHFNFPKSVTHFFILFFRAKAFSAFSKEENKVGKRFDAREVTKIQTKKKKN
jgi:hypothetical protein